METGIDRQWLLDLANKVTNVDTIASLEKQAVNRAVLVSFVNPHSVFVASSQRRYSAALAKMDVLVPDGMLMARYCSLISNRPVYRQSFDGNSLAPNVFRYCQENDLEIYLVGGASGIAEKAGRVYAEEYGIRVAGARNGWFADEKEMRDFARTLRGFSGIVIVGMGAPHQELFLAQLKEAGWQGLAFSCGGYFDQTTMNGAQYYPDWINKLNLRFAYRLWHEPRRLGRRYFVEYLPFFFQAARSILTRKGRR